MRLFGSRDGYQAALQSQRVGEIKRSSVTARVIEGHNPRFQAGEAAAAHKPIQRKGKGMTMCTVKGNSEIREDCKSQHLTWIQRILTSDANTSALCPGEPFTRRVLESRCFEF